jgi:hypothetical protein
MAELIALGMVKTTKIGQARSQVPNRVCNNNNNTGRWDAVHRLNVGGLE